MNTDLIKAFEDMIAAFFARSSPPYFWLGAEADPD